MEKLTNLLDMNHAWLSEYLTSIGQPTYRTAQLYNWMMQGAALGEMSNLPKAMRERIAADGVYTLPKVVTKQTSKDGTTKFLFELADGERVESVVMKYRHGNSICVSTQAGCRMGCKFCASSDHGGGAKFSRNLTSGEMLGQVIVAQREIGERIGGIVLMGVGEPLDNYDNVLGFIRAAGAENGLNISLRSVALSTCGLADKIRQLAEEELPITLSVSLHAPDDHIRSEIMPINAR
ncbi:MAG: radical SAM protein, partial [Oscillospiraceae bacterium]|nr:radical SAM protein [Oscillospiraceae bacterium]